MFLILVLPLRPLLCPIDFLFNVLSCQWNGKTIEQFLFGCLKSSEAFLEQVFGFTWIQTYKQAPQSHKVYGLNFIDCRLMFGWLKSALKPNTDKTFDRPQETIPSILQVALHFHSKLTIINFNFLIFFCLCLQSRLSLFCDNLNGPPFPTLYTLFLWLNEAGSGEKSFCREIFQMSSLNPWLNDENRRISKNDRDLS